MKNIQTTNEGESKEQTMQFIESKRNWDVANQRYRVPEAEVCKANLADCKIYWRGEYLILEHNNIIHYWDSFPYCFLKQALEYMDIDAPAAWKTLDKLISLRMAIRQTEVNGMGYVESVLDNEKMTLQLYTKFMRLARAQDVQHHGSRTF